MMPPSPSRKRSNRFVGNRDYFRDKRPGWKIAWSVCGKLAAFGVLVWILWNGRTLRNLGFASVRPSSHGKLAQVHAMWENECWACHVPTKEQESSGFLNVQDRWFEFRCNHCHGDAVHHQTAKWDEALEGKTQRQCAECHRDHQGRDHSLIQMADTNCTRCHENLDTHRKPPVVAAQGRAPDERPTYQPSITHFARKPTSDASGSEPSPGEHPEFKLLAEESKTFGRRMKFNHALHMAPGLKLANANADAKEKARRPMTFAEIADDFRFLYLPDGSPKAEPSRLSSQVQLECGNCHQTDAGRDVAEPKWKVEAVPVDVARTPRASGAHMLPINFDVHCRGCHPMTLNGIREGHEKDALQLPHRLQPKELSDWLDTYYRKFVQLETEAAKAEPQKAEPQKEKPEEDPKIRNDKVPHHESRATELKRFQAYVAKDLNYLFEPNDETRTGDKCVMCHKLTNGAPREIVPPEIPTVWFKHARFDHVSHRAVRCQDCHPDRGTVGVAGVVAGPQSKYEAGDELLRLRGIESCRACHGPAGNTLVRDPESETQELKLVEKGEVRHGCTDCHSYHNGDRPLQALGAPLRNPPRPLGIEGSTEGFLRGDGK